MEKLTAAPVTFNFFGIELPLVLTIMTWIVILTLVIFGALATRSLNIIPKRLQNFAEMIYEFLADIVFNALGEKDGRKFFPFIFSLFCFVLLANIIGIIPNFFQLIGGVFALIHKGLGSTNVVIESASLSKTTINVIQPVWYDFLLKFPDFQEPTRSLNTCLALALITFIHVHTYGIKNKGLLTYFGEYMDPVPAKFPYILFFWINPFFYLNIIGVVSNVVSHSFRLFGNLFGGFMIIAIVSSLLNYLLIPVGLMAFFGLFAGAVQAFVFMMLAVTYISQMR